MDRRMLTTHCIDSWKVKCRECLGILRDNQSGVLGTSLAKVANRGS